MHTQHICDSDYRTCWTFLVMVSMMLMPRRGDFLQHTQRQPHRHTSAHVHLPLSTIPFYLNQSIPVYVLTEG